MVVIRYIGLFAILCGVVSSWGQNFHRENGWYHMKDDAIDCLSIEPIITVKDFVGLKLDTDYFGKYVICGQISKHKLAKWADETESAIGKRIAFVFNDSIISDPQVNGRIESGTFQISSNIDKVLPEIYRQLVREKSDCIEVLFKEWDKDSLYYTLTSTQRDSIRMALDYWEAEAWINLTIQSDKDY